MVNGVPTTIDFTEPETTIVSPILYDDLSVLVVISAAVGEELDVVSCAKMGTDKVENNTHDIIIKMDV
jgi:hypothetical protein